ncbi:MAG: hypothetical protein V4684_08680 [Pseudomonadota bacterium]
MAYSSILGADVAPVHPSGRDSASLGPSDNSDTGSDTVGTYEALGDSDSVGTGERGSVTLDDGREGGDILPDRVVNMEGGDVDPAENLPDLTDLDEDAPEASSDEPGDGV